MKEYDTGIRSTSIVAVVIAIVAVAGLFTASTLINNVIPTTTTTGTNTNPPSGNYGIRAATYLESRRDDVVFYWMYNSSFVNEDLSDFYKTSHPDAYVDGVRMNRTDAGGIINVLFAPWSAGIIGEGVLPSSEWETMSGSLVNTIESLADYPGTPEIPDWYPTFTIGIYFDDGTFFLLQYYSAQQAVSLINGTWDGFNEWGWPNDISFAQTELWLDAANRMETPMNDFYTAITETVAYPSG